MSSAYYAMEFNYKQGEIQLLHLELNSTDIGIRIEAIKKVIVYMTIGKDISSLF